VLLIDTVRNSSGLYTIAEAARYAKMPQPTLSCWLYGNKVRPALRGATIPKEEGKFITFMEFVEALAVRSLRANYAVPLQRIREALDEAKKKFGVDYPFANKKHKTFLIGKDLHILLQGNENLVQLCGKEKGQQSFKPCLEQFMNDLTFDEKDVAVAYTAYRYVTPQAQRQVSITLKPTYCFGDPTVEGTGYRAETLWRAALAEGSEQKAAEYYEVDTDSVVAACRYCEEIEMAA